LRTATAVTGLFVANTVTTPMAEVSAMGRMHVVAGISAFVVLPLAAATINISLPRTVAWAGSRMLLLVTGSCRALGSRP
jgi:hypothetical protein